MGGTATGRMAASPFTSEQSEGTPLTVTTPDWVRDAIFYQIFPDRFARGGINGQLKFEDWDAPPTIHGFKGGCLDGVTDRLDYLQDLGVTAIYFTPVFASAANHRYHTYDYFHVDPLLGGNVALRRLLDAAHERQMRIVLDGVFNHASRGFWQFHHTLENGLDSPYADWFHFHPERLDRSRHFAAYPDPDAQAALAAGVSSYDALGYHAWWNLPALPKFNTAAPAVREFLWSVSTHWIDFGIDGWRLDVPSEIDDDSFWQEFRRRVKERNPDAYLVGEIWHEAHRWLQGDQFDAVMNYPLTAACLGFFGNDALDLHVARQPGGLRHVCALSAEAFAHEVDRVLDLYDPAVNAVQLNLLDSHDTPRFLTAVSGDTTALEMAIQFLMTIPGAPCLFYGDEVGLDGGPDPDCRKAFPWNEADWDHDLHRYVRRCIGLRREHPALRRGDFTRLLAHDGVFAFARRSKDDTVIVVFNQTREDRTVDLPLHGLSSAGHRFVEEWSGVERDVTDGCLRQLTVGPRSGRTLCHTD
jgi:cyclomaltodextrinase / maltogenic alpha-amylase / neopullulanase